MNTIRECAGSVADPLNSVTYRREVLLVCCQMHVTQATACMGSSRVGHVDCFEVGVFTMITVQAMNAQEAREMLKASLQKPNLVAQVVPSPITFTWDATIQQIIREHKLGDLIYVEVWLSILSQPCFLR